MAILGIEKSPNLTFFDTDILQNTDLKFKLSKLQETYNSNRYSFPGYGIFTDKLLEKYSTNWFFFL